MRRASAGRQANSWEDVGCDGDAVCIYTDAVTDNIVSTSFFCVFADCGVVYLAPRFTNLHEILLRP